MKEFLESYGADNKLLKSVLFDLKQVEFVAGLKALGILYKLVTCPLWSTLENPNITITDMNHKYNQLVTFLDDASKNITDFMTGELLPFGAETYIERDPKYDCLMSNDTYDNIVEMFLQIILPALCKLGKRLFADHLPGGKLENMTEEMKRKVQAAPKTTCFAESVFGQLDQILRSKPNISTLAAESCIMFLNNKTLDWLEGKQKADRQQLMRDASKGVKKLKLVYRQRLSEIEENRRISIHEKIQKKEAIRAEKIRKQEHYTGDIIHHGLWQSQREIDNMIASYPTTAAQLTAIKAQLRFRKDVLHQIPDDKITFNFTKAQEGKKSRKSLSVKELEDNLKKLVRQAIVKDNVTENQRHILVGKRVKHRFFEEGKEKWYTGKVISQVPSFPDWFNIIYDNDKDVYTYHHLDTDLNNNDLEILV